MAWPSINSQNFLKMDGVPDPAKTRLEILERPGVDGQGYRDIGTRGEPFQLRCDLDVVNRTTAANFMATFRGWIGDQVNVSDGVATWSSLTVLDVVQVGAQDISSAVGGVTGSSATVIMSVVFTMMGNA